MILSRTFYNRDTVEVAKDLIGKKLVRVIDGQQIAAIIIETEAYRSDDPACHAHRGKTKRNEALFGPVGRTYVYFTYGMHFCLNIVSRDAENYPAGGVLIRALMPIEGHTLIKKNRPRYTKGLLNGPGIVTQALSINREFIGCDVTNPQSPIFIEEGISLDPKTIQSTPRIGISQAKDALWRFLAPYAVKSYL